MMSQKALGKEYTALTSNRDFFESVFPRSCISLLLFSPRYHSIATYTPFTSHEKKQMAALAQNAGETHKKNKHITNRNRI